MPSDGHLQNPDEELSQGILSEWHQLTYCYPISYQGWGEYNSGTPIAQNDKHKYTKNIVVE